MDDPTSVLFAGVHINKKRFSTDIQRFEGCSSSAAALLQADGGAAAKKRKCEDPTDIGKLPDNAEEKKGILRKKFKIHTKGEQVPKPLENFQELREVYKCPSYLMRNISEAGYREPTPIQRQAIPVMVQGRECFACAPTGSGKTLAFILPILMKLKKPSREGIRALVMCPTRELATQITREFKRLIKGKKFFVRQLTKTLLNCADFSELRCDVLVATPLRLNALVSSSKADLSSVEILVLDESDKLFELGFLEQIDAAVNACTHPVIVRALFSATLPDTVEELARSIMHDAVRIVIGERNTAAETVKQELVFTGSEEGKLLALKRIFKENFQPPILLFVQSKERAKQLYQEFAFEDVRMDSIHADCTQSQREKAVEKFREGKTWVLVATDLMARGIDFKGVNCVINYDVPHNVTTYIHRIGRSGRAGRPGNAITLYTEEDVPFLRSIANAVKASGCEVPEWMLSLPKSRSKKLLPPKRDPVSTKPTLPRRYSKKRVNKQKQESS